MDDGSGEVFGPHLMLDLAGCDPSKLADMAHVWGVLDQLPIAIGMTKITQPYCFPYEGKVPEDRGVTGFVVIAESHISVHTFVEKGYAFVDLFSCKSFDVSGAREYLVAAFGATRVVSQVAIRGRDFPRGVVS